MKTAGRACLFFLLLSLVAPSSPAKERRDKGFVIRGSVIDSATREPLEGATVQIVSLGKGGVADRGGWFTLTGIPEGMYEVSANYLGYSATTVKVRITRDTTIHFLLAMQAIPLPQVVVTGHSEEPDLLVRTKFHSVLRGGQLDKVRGQHLGSIVSELPGVTLLQTGTTISKPVIRGLHSQRVVILQAGIQQEGQQWGGEHAPEIDPFAPDKVTVIRGASAVAYGSGAMGGVIAIEPKELPITSDISGRFTIQTFSNSRQGAGNAMLEGGLAAAQGFGWRISGSYRRAGDAETAEYVIGNSGFEEYNGTLLLGYHEAGSGLDIYLTSYNTRLGIYSGSHIGTLANLNAAIASGRPLRSYDFTYTIGAPYQKISHQLLSVRGHIPVGSIGRFDLQYGWQQNHRQEFDAHRALGTPLSRPAFDLELTTTSLDGKVTHQEINGFTGSLGLSLQKQGNANDGSSALIPNFTGSSAGIYLIESLSLGSSAVSGGIRYDRKQIDVYSSSFRHLGTLRHIYDAISGAAGAEIQITEHLTLLANAGSSWRAPSVNEMYNYGVHHGTAQFEIGDPNLKTERSFDLNATAEYSSELTTFQVSVFHNLYENFITLTPRREPTLTLRGIFPTFEYKQSRARIAGFDGEITSEVSSGLSLRLKGSFLWGDNLDSGEPLFQMPPHQGSITFRHEPEDITFIQRSFMELEFFGALKQTRTPQNIDHAEAPPGYVLVHFRLGATILTGWSPLETQVSVTNLFNTLYKDYLGRFRYFIHDQGRNIRFELRVPIGDSP